MAEVKVEWHYECAECGRIHVRHDVMAEDEFCDLADRDPDDVYADYCGVGKNVIFRTDVCRDCEYGEQKDE